MSLDKDIANLEQTRNALLSSMQQVSDTLLKLDITTLNASIEKTTEEGKRKKLELDNVLNEIKEIGDVDFSVEDYDKIILKLNKLSSDKAKFGEQYKNIKSTIDHLQKSEYCPTCGRKLDNVDNSAKIKELSRQLDSITKQGKEISQTIKETNDKIASMKENRDKYNTKNKLTMKKSALEMNIERLRNELREMILTKKEYQKIQMLLTQIISLAYKSEIAILSFQTSETQKKTTLVG